jgi:hypothetical protein
MVPLWVRSHSVELARPHRVPLCSADQYSWPPSDGPPASFRRLFPPLQRTGPQAATHLAGRAWTTLRRGTPYMLRDIGGLEVTVTENKGIVLERSQVPEEVRRRSRIKKAVQVPHEVPAARAARGDPPRTPALTARVRRSRSLPTDRGRTNQSALSYPPLQRAAAQGDTVFSHPAMSLRRGKAGLVPNGRRSRCSNGASAVDGKLLQRCGDPPSAQGAALRKTPLHGFAFVKLR